MKSIFSVCVAPKFVLTTIIQSTTLSAKAISSLCTNWIRPLLHLLRLLQSVLSVSNNLRQLRSILHRHIIDTSI
ncbi:hypothetical protein PENTCL1PPCAC_12300 [Pristionchus entomophagus]|uniref:Uncharacterized protein n=1 Tax=Pristionchus entomophagus TaxID=358040 RepID=A0AAV5T3Q3_9BILA|nr:hypothetical protein PENTCL1PPCAC_12300 [Pristionchus entomophagus]